MDIFIICLICVCVILQIIILIKQSKLKNSTQNNNNDNKGMDLIRSEISNSQSTLRQELSALVQSSIKSFGDIISDNQRNSSEIQSAKLDEMDKSIIQKQELMNNSIQAQMKQFEERLKTLESTNEQKLDAIRETVSKKLSYIQEDNNNKLNEIQNTVNDKLQKTLEEKMNSSFKSFGDIISDNQRNSAEIQSAKLDEMDKSIVQKQELMNNSVQAQMKQFEERLKTLESTNEQKLDAMRETISKRLSYIQEDNNNKLNEIQNTVNDKLQKTLEEKMNSSFKLVSERLEQVYKGLGEMQSIAVGVGDLKKVLSQVKTRGILGEIQLGAILSEILTSDQYDTEVPTVPNSSERVEFAVKLPAKDDGGFIYLPIDSKFPGDTFSNLQDAYANGDKDEIQMAYKKLENVIKKSAKDIHDKYIAPPYTTNFAIMFLPFEGLYAEVVNHGLVEVLQRDYNVNIAGPSTMAAMLNSLQMGFKTLQIQKRSNEVWEVLSAVKTEFDNFEKVFDSAKKRIRQLDEDMDKLVGVRTRAIKRKLRDVQSSSEIDSKQILSIENDDI